MYGIVKVGDHSRIFCSEYPSLFGAFLGHNLQNHRRRFGWSWTDYKSWLMRQGNRRQFLGPIFWTFLGWENCPPCLVVEKRRDFVGFCQKVVQRRRCCFFRVFCLFWPNKDLDLWQASWPHKSNQNTLSGLTFCRGFWSSLLHRIASGLSCMSDFLNQFPLQKDTRRVTMQTWQHVILRDDNFCSFLVWVGYSVQKGCHISSQWKLYPWSIPPNMQS